MWGEIMNKEEFSNELIEMSNKIDIELTSNQVEKFYKFMNLLLEWNEKMNLTAITDPKDIILKHFIDSITIKKYLNNVNKVLDMGSGAGFPGIPLKIVTSDIEFTLVDSLNKRIIFLDEVCKQLELNKISNIHSRAEELAKNLNYREQYDVVTSRAVARLTSLVEYMLPFAKVGGNCICMKGSNVEEELNEAKNAIKILGGNIEKVDKFLLPKTDIERNIVIIKKIKNTPSKYPRKPGTATKQPII